MTPKELADELQCLPDEAVAYYDTVKKEFVIALNYEDEYFPLIDDMDEKDEMIALPDSFEINDRKMMLRFAQYNSSDELLSTLNGKSFTGDLKTKSMNLDSMKSGINLKMSGIQMWLKIGVKEMD